MTPNILHCFCKPDSRACKSDNNCHGDITYVDEALYEDKLSLVFDDMPAARETQDRIREFVRNHPTVYCGTHTPQGYENLKAKRVIDLDNPVPTVFAEVDFSQQAASGKYVFFFEILR